MYYRLTYINENKNELKEFASNRENAEKEAWVLLESHDNIGKVLIERRESEYYGEYKFCLAITKSGDSNRPVHETPMFYPISDKSTKWSEISPFKQLKLEEEDPTIRRLIWICQSKKNMFDRSAVRQDFNSARDEQIKILESQGVPYSEIAEKATRYDCWHELIF